MITSAELVRVAGITLRNVQWWDEQNVIKARRLLPDGRNRIYDDDLVLKTFIVRELRARRVSLKKIRRLELIPVKADYLLISRNRIEWAKAGIGLVERIARLKSPVSLISIKDLRMEFKAAMERRAGVTFAHRGTRSAAVPSPNYYKISRQAFDDLPGRAAALAL